MPISWRATPIMYVGKGSTHPSCCIGASPQQFLYLIWQGVAKIKIPTLVYTTYRTAYTAVSLRVNPRGSKSVGDNRN